MAYKTVTKAKDLMIYQHSESSAPWAVSVSAVRRNNIVTFDAVMYADWIPTESNSVQIRDGTYTVITIPNHDSVLSSSLDWCIYLICTRFRQKCRTEDLMHVHVQMVELYNNLMNVKEKQHVRRNHEADHR